MGTWNLPYHLYIFFLYASSYFRMKLQGWDYSHSDFTAVGWIGVCLFVCKCQKEQKGTGSFSRAELLYPVKHSSLPQPLAWSPLTISNPPGSKWVGRNKHHHHNKLVGPVFAETISSSEPQLELRRVWEECSKPRKDWDLTPCLLSLVSCFTHHFITLDNFWTRTWM